MTGAGGGTHMLVVCVCVCVCVWHRLVGWGEGHSVTPPHLPPQCHPPTVTGREGAPPTTFLPLRLTLGWDGMGWVGLAGGVPAPPDPPGNLGGSAPQTHKQSVCAKLPDCGC
jgi:hypothetical protein